MRPWGRIVQVAFTYIGTIVGAGFASGQEILQFFTQYGGIATATIALATVLFIGFGIKLMLLAQKTGARSYEDLNRTLFGPGIGEAFSLFLMIVLLGTAGVMLAGAGTLFAEQLGLSYQTGLWITLVLGYLVLSKGMHGILAVNTVVVPFMLLFTAVVALSTWSLPNASNWLWLTSDYPLLQIWTAPLLYSAFNLATAQAVLVPLGTAIRDRGILIWGGVLGGAGIGLLLLAAHFALSAQMPGILQYEIPMGHIIRRLGAVVQFLYVLVIFGEIFTTFIADVFGLILQIEQRFRISRQAALLGILALSYGLSLVGFRPLLSFLYPLFGMVSLLWLGWILVRNRTGTSDRLPPP
ncbi:hypothetical protein MJA45_18995 [Paenibacillus aurantius]|uniref:Transporter n=1 Tax=Paenibacillus aurantius TaxID=2918900 RepID=A0AA96RDD7_9BACL|nr:hypothetical protein [Paenibacillus aurantius]WNQ09702.1 hypothetical protein MJA45_18995 [Paenibacillus aurantius]